MAKTFQESLVNLLIYFSYIILAVVYYLFNYIWYKIIDLFFYLYYKNLDPKKKDNLEKLLKKAMLPVSIIVKSEFETARNYFSEMYKFRIKINTENVHYCKRMQAIENTALISAIDNKNNLIFCINSGSYKNLIHKFNRQKSETRTKVIKQKLFSLNIAEKDILLSFTFLKKFVDIMTYPDDNVRAEKLYKIFDENGYYIPLTIHLGGMAISEIKENISTISKSEGVDLWLDVTKDKIIDVKDGDNDEKNKMNINIENKDKEEKQLEMEDNKNISKFIGGDKEKFSRSQLDEWQKSISIDNCEIIEYSSYISVRNILPTWISKSLNKSLDLVERRYKQREKYYDIIKSLKPEHPQYIIGKGNVEIGICKESDEIPIIKKESENLVKDYKYFSYRHYPISKSTGKNLIVGFSLKWKNINISGDYQFYQNPLLKTSLQCLIESQKGLGIDVVLDLYSIIDPEENQSQITTKNKID